MDIDIVETKMFCRVLVAISVCKEIVIEREHEIALCFMYEGTSTTEASLAVDNDLLPACRGQS